MLLKGRNKPVRIFFSYGKIVNPERVKNFVPYKEGVYRFDYTPFGIEAKTKKIKRFMKVVYDIDGEFGCDTMVNVEFLDSATPHEPNRISRPKTFTYRYEVIFDLKEPQYDEMFL